MYLSDEELAKKIDHTLLVPEAKETCILKLCREARAFGFKAVCVQPYFVELCVSELAGSGVDVAAVIGFPLGANLKEVKAFEAQKAFSQKAREVDMVINIGALKDGKQEYIRQEIENVVEVSRQYPGTLVKVIIETALLSTEEKVLACELAVQAGADFVKTSTGFNGPGATVEDVLLMSKVLQNRAKIKASGGIRTREQAERLLSAGAHRLGTSSGTVIVAGNNSFI